ncbi:hypothetical protein A1O1_00317 [Capronia coronata CBS 617.96]|uniref:Zn(2)-C6 fungal-type domain-containing protein n=1 Tax=Capronia coronata CBS 617.96 TaxID=1182541 RepID=W9YRK5_9EURO|nr:uncharacterized protein A1O1_00317 [Capronia coronata CBS 617.96]EXJ95198.1 hypothetical protein A1O1_00317 [Capronia coronata CBS 617.96]
MAGNVNGRDPSGDDPKPNFPVPGAPEFTQITYPFPIDSELTMPSNYPMPQYQRQLEDVAQPVDTAGHGSLNNTPLNPAGASPTAANTDPAITMSQPADHAPPSFAPGALPVNVDNSSERAQAPQTGDKRKRSKTSRACDECRRKKVRCDAPTEADGTPKTCSNCQKAGALCEFERKPMKRGPSRGYIRELSERVEQVELVQKQALRQSMDAGVAFAPYAETMLPKSAGSATKRTFSFNEPRPFAQSDFQRDRIPSSGAWGLHSSSSAAAPANRPRDRGSLAIAPDQANPASGPLESEPTQAFETVDPNWPAPETSPPPKRRQLEPSANLQPFKMETTFLNRYYKQVEPLFPLLPDAATVVKVIAQAPEFSHAFAVAVELFPYANDDVTVNGDHDNGPSNASPEMNGDRTKRALSPDLFQNYTGLAAYMAEQMKEDPQSRTEDENLACLWTFLLLALESDNDIRTIEKVPMSKSELLQYSLVTLAHLRSGGSFSSEDDTIKDRAQFDRIVKQAYNCAFVLAKYHSLSIGIGGLDLAAMGDQLLIGQVAATECVTPEAAFIAESTTAVGYAYGALFGTEGQGKEMAIFFIKTLIRPTLANTVERFSQLGEENPIVQQVMNFVDSLTVRVHRRMLDVDIMKTCAGMSAALASEAAASPENKHRFNPLDVHVSALLVITLCDFVNNCNSIGLTDIAHIYLNRAQELLQKKSEAFHKGYGFEWFYAPYAPENKEVADQYRMSHWTDCLLRMIDWIQTKPATIEKTHNMNLLVLPDFQKTAKTGWLNILSRFSG